MDEAERLCDRLAIVDHGQIIAEGTPSGLIDRLGGHHVVEFQIDDHGKRNANGHETELWRALPSVESVRCEEDHEENMVCLNVREPHLTIPALLAAINQQGHRLEHLSTRQASLEDVFVQLTGRHLRED
jgi:ABC-2 type transport system ATP-binding protein